MPRGLVLLRQSQARSPWSPGALLQADPWKAYVFRGAFGAQARVTDPLTVRLVTDNYREAKARLAEALMEAKVYPMAESEFVALGLLKPQWAGPWVQAGNAAFQRGALVAAGGHWQRGVTEEPGSAEALANLGLYHFYMKDYERSMALARQALERDPKLPNALNLLEQSRLRVAGQSSAPPAIPAADPGLQAASEGDKAANEGRADEAIQAYEKAMRLGFVNAGIHRNIAVMYAKQNKMAQAVASIKKAIALEPKNAEQHRYLGIFLFNMGERAPGIKALQESARLDPKDATTRALLEQAGAAMKPVAP